MSTNSRLRMVLPSGKALKPIYCHWDGYPEHHLPILREHYNTVEKAEELLSLGNISVLAPKVKPDPGMEHSFENPIRDLTGRMDVTIAYHRDRGENLEFWGNRQGYNYLFNGETWELEKEN
jgi:hypothetical protein